MPLVAVLQPILTVKNDGIFQYEPSEMVAEYIPRLRNFILGMNFGFSNSNILLVVALALLLIVTISLVTIRCRKWRKAHSKGNTSQVKCFPYSLGSRGALTHVLIAYEPIFSVADNGWNIFKSRTYNEYWFWSFDKFFTALQCNTIWQCYCSSSSISSSNRSKGTSW